MKPDKLLKELKDRDIIDEDDIQFAKESLRQTGSTIEDILVEKELVRGAKLAEVKSDILNIPVVESEEIGEIDRKILNLVPVDVVETYKIIPFGREEDGSYKIGMVYPENLEAREALRFLESAKGVRFSKYLLSPDDFESLTQQYEKLESELQQALESVEEEYTDGSSGEGEKIETAGRLKELAEQAPITKVVHVIMRYAVESGASDIHIEPLEDQVRVRFRVDGVLHSPLFLPKNVLSAIVSRIKVLASLQIDETRMPQDGRIHTKFSGKTIDFRVSTLPVTEGEKVVMRVLDPEKGLLTLEDLGLQNKALSDIKKAANSAFGAVLISGPTGSGKSTTLYSVLKRIQEDEDNIVTLEDPVEYYVDGINQSQIRPDIGYEFATGLRHIVRQDPDIIMVGEIRDNETAALSTHAALTGHLVLSTIHTNDAIGIIPRLLDMGVQDFLIPASVNLAVAQRLIPTLCNNCKYQYEPSENTKEKISEEMSYLSEQHREKWGVDKLIEDYKENSHKLWKAEGKTNGKEGEVCQECGGTGISGRIAVFETLFMTEELEDVVVTEPTEENLQKQAKKQGMISMRMDGVIKALQGKVGISAVFASTQPTY